MAEEESEQSVLGQAWDITRNALVWDDELPWYVNAGFLAGTVASIAAAAPSGGTSLVGVVGVAAARAAAKETLKEAAKAGIKVVVKEGVEEAAKITGKVAARETAEKVAAEKVAAEAAAKVAAEKVAAEAAAKVAAEKVAAEAAAKATAEKAAAEAAAKKAAEEGTKKKTFIENMLSDYPRKKGLVYLGWTVAGAAGLLKVGDVGLNWYENSHGHPVAKWLADRARKNIDSLIEAGTLNEETLVNIIEGVASKLSLLKDFSSSVVGGMETAGFAISLGDHPTPEEVQRAKEVALGFALKDPLLLLRAGLRERGAKHLFPDQNERDLYLTNKFVEDLVKGADNAAFSKENKVTENDVKVDLKRLMVRGGVEADILRKFPHLENGLRQKWPDLFDAPAPVVKEAPESIAAPTTPTAPTTPEKAVVPPAPVVTMPVVSAPVVSDKGKGRENDMETKPEGSGQVNWLSVDPGKLKGFDLTTAFDKVADAAGKVDRWDMKLLSTLMEVAKGVSPLFNMLGMQETGDRFMRFSLGLAQHAMKSQFGDKFDIAMVPKPGFVPAPAP